MTNIKKIIAFVLALYLSIPLAFAEVWDILYVRYPYSPVISSPTASWSVFIAMLQQWYIVQELWKNWDYTNVRLTDEKIGYVLTNNLRNIRESTYLIQGVSWVLTRDVTFYHSGNFTSSAIWTLTSWTKFTIYHINSTNTDFYRIRVSDWTYEWKIWYIEKDWANLNGSTHYKSDIELFLEKYNNNGYNSAWEENDYNSAYDQPIDPYTPINVDPYIPIDSWNNNNGNNNGNTNTTPTTDDKKPEEDDFIKTLEDLLNGLGDSSSGNWNGGWTSSTSSGSSTTTGWSTTNSGWTTQEDDGDSFIKELERILQGL